MPRHKELPPPEHDNGGGEWQGVEDERVLVRESYTNAQGAIIRRLQASASVITYSEEEEEGNHLRARAQAQVYGKEEGRGGGGGRGRRVRKTWCVTCCNCLVEGWCGLDEITNLGRWR